MTNKEAIINRYKFEKKVDQLNNNKNTYVFRTSKEEEILIKDLLQNITNHIISNKRIVSFSVVSDNSEEKNSYECDNFEDYEVLEDFIEIDNDKLKFIAPDNNVVLHITYRRQDTNLDIPIHVHINGYGYEGDEVCESYACVNASIMWKEGNVLNSALALITYDCNGFEKIKSKIEASINNVESLSNDEKEIVKEAFQDNTEIGLAYLNNGQFVDALSSLEYEYRELNREPDADKKLYSSLAYNIGACYLQRYQFKKALHYFDVANTFCNNKETSQALLHSSACANDLNTLWLLETAKKEADAIAHNDKEYQNFLSNIEDVLKTTHEPNNEKNLFYQILNFFGVIHSEVSSMIVEKKGLRPYIVDNQLEIIGFNIVPELYGCDDMTLYISHRSSRDYVCKELLGEDSDYPTEESKKIPNASPDKSKVKTNGEIIVHISRINDIATVNIMVPSFSKLPNKLNGYPQVASFKYYLNAVMTPEQFNELRSSSIKKVSEKEEELGYGEYFSLGMDAEAHYYFIMGLQAFNYKIYGTALYFLSQAYELVAAKRYTDQIDNIDKEMMMEAAYMLGVIHMANHEYDTAAYYLRPLSQLDKKEWKDEYAKALTLNGDLKFIDAIKGSIG
ncbi:MAG: hypothetical protein MJZ19_01540 [Paludibacteraceae bacterium]|nr:hypothetical protein [Paludibacteraceae bacterium]